MNWKSLCCCRWCEIHSWDGQQMQPPGNWAPRLIFSPPNLWRRQNMDRRWKKEEQLLCPRFTTCLSLFREQEGAVPNKWQMADLLYIWAPNKLSTVIHLWFAHWSCPLVFGHDHSKLLSDVSIGNLKFKKKLTQHGKVPTRNQVEKHSDVVELEIMPRCEHGVSCAMIWHLASTR